VGFLLLSKENKLDLLIGKGKVYLIEGRVFVKKNLPYHKFKDYFKLGNILKNKISRWEMVFSPYVVRKTT